MTTRIRPNYSNAGQSLVRAITADLLTAAERTTYSDDVVKRCWPHDRDAELIVRSASSPAVMTTAAWAGSLAATALADFILNMGPASAGSALLRRGLQLNFQNKAAIMVPGLLSAATNTSFVQEGEPIPVRQLSLDGPTLSPRKFATITAFSREMFLHSVPTIESLTRAVLTESVGLALDSALLDATEGDAARPGGLRYNIAAVGGASAATPRSEAMAEDIATLVTAVAPVAGNVPIIIVASPAQAAALRVLWNRANLDYEVLSSSGLAAGVVVAIAPNALVSAIDPAPRFDVSTQSTLHMEDTTPLAIGTAGTPPTVAAPTRNLFQTDTLALRLRMEVSWALRNAGALAWLENVTW